METSALLPLLQLLLLLLLRAQRLVNAAILRQLGSSQVQMVDGCTVFGETSAHV